MKPANLFLVPAPTGVEVPAGRRGDDGPDKAAEIRVLAKVGRARVDSVVLERLEEVKGSGP